MFDYNSTTINGTCDQCLCTIVLNSTLISAFNCFPNNQTCEIFTEPLNTSSFTLINNNASSVYFMSLATINSTLTTTSAVQNSTSVARITSLTTTNETVFSVWNTTSGGDSIQATIGIGVGNYPLGQGSNCAFDNTTSTKYLNFGTCTFTDNNSFECGEHTGFYLTPQQGPSLLLYLQFCTADDLPNRDPLLITIEGSNQSSSMLTLGSSWALIYNGSTGLQSTTNRSTCGANQSIPNNSVWYFSYRVLVTSKRGVEAGTQYSEVKLMGYQ